VLRIVFFTLSFPTPWQPAAAPFNRTMVEALSELHDVRVVAPVPWTQRFRPATGGPRASKAVHPLYLYTPGLLREHYGTFLWASCRRTLRVLAEKLQPDVFLAYWTHPDGEVALRIAREAGRPVVVIVGGSDVMLLAEDDRRGPAIRRVLRSADGLLTVGERLRERVIELGAPPERAVAFRRGVDTRMFCPGDSREARARLGLPAGGRVVLWAGRMVPVKAVDVLLEAWRLLALPPAEARLCLVGDGPLQPWLRSQARDLGPSGAVAFPGGQRQEALPDWYRAADVTVLPSLSEGIPNVLLESLACGTPFVASDIGGVREIDAGPHGTLVPPARPDALAAALRGRLDSPSRAVLPAGFALRESTASVSGMLERVVRDWSRVGGAPGVLA
jgi:glycosyltransferase involved in cell wall biosynthesis